MMKKNNFPVIEPGTEGFDENCKGGDSRMVCQRIMKENGYWTNDFELTEVSGETYLKLLYVSKDCMM